MERWPGRHRASWDSSPSELVPNGSARATSADTLPPLEWIPRTAQQTVANRAHDEHGCAGSASCGQVELLKLPSATQDDDREDNRSQSEWPGLPQASFAGNLTTSPRSIGAAICNL